MMENETTFWTPVRAFHSASTNFSLFLRITKRDHHKKGKASSLGQVLLKVQRKLTDKAPHEQGNETITTNREAMSDDALSLHLEHDTSNYCKYRKYSMWSVQSLSLIHATIIN